MKHFGDITKIKGSDVPLVDIVCGGSPCQDLSIAGRREGLSGERSGLFMEQIRIIKEMRERDKSNRGADVDIRFLRPRFMVWENVPGAFSSNKGEDFRCVLEETAKIVCEDAIIPEPPKGKWSPSGCIMGDGWSIAWRVHDAQFWGVPQRRKRISLVADFGGESAPEILFERQGVPGDIEESGEQGQGVAANTERSIDKTSKCLNAWDVQSKHIQPENGIAEALYAGECRYAGGESYVLQNRAISFLERAGCDGGVRESLSNTNEQQHCQHSTTNTYCIGNGQVHDAMTPSPVCKTLNTMDDPMKIMTVSQDAYDKFSENDKSASLKASGGTYGGGGAKLL